MGAPAPPIRQKFANQSPLSIETGSGGSAAPK